MTIAVDLGRKATKANKNMVIIEIHYNFSDYLRKYLF